MKKLVIFTIFFGLLWCAVPVYAIEETPLLDNGTVQTPKQVSASERFGRSIANIASSPLEIPAQMYIRALYQERTARNSFAVAGGLVEGVVVGTILYFPWRLWAGVFDLGTLWWDTCDRAIIDPEYLSFSIDRIEKERSAP